MMAQMMGILNAKPLQARRETWFMFELDLARQF